MKPSKTYKITLEVGKWADKKILYKNQTGEDCEFYIYSNDPELMLVKESIVNVSAENKGKF